MNDTLLTYSGDVQISLLINGKVVSLYKHNAGTDNLMKTFAKAITGNSLTTSDLPNFIDVYDSENNTCLKQKCVITERVFTYDTVTYTPSSWVATFTTVIPFSYFLATINESGTYRLVMQSGYDPNGDVYELASLNILGTELAKITAGTSAIVKWNMRVYNAPAS